MRLGLVSLIRNEADIVGPFLRHAAALFDHAVLMDHGSTDGTTGCLAAAARQRPGWQHWRVEVSGYHQAAFCGFAMRHLFAATDTDIVLFLDADEFLDVADRAALEGLLAPLAGQSRTVGRLAWRNACPLRLNGRFGGRLHDRLRLAAEPSAFGKAVVTRTLMEETAGRAAPQTGNHTVDPGDGAPLACLELGGILHVPVRSLEQIRRKAVLGALASLAHSDREPHVSSHWFELAARVAAGTLRAADLPQLAFSYGESGTAARGSGGGVRRLRELARDRRLVLPRPPGADALAQTAGLLGDWRPAPSAGLALHLEDGVLRAL